jgi:hypothetical protein
MPILLFPSSRASLRVRVICSGRTYTHGTQMRPHILALPYSFAYVGGALLAGRWSEGRGAASSVWMSLKEDSLLAASPGPKRTGIAFAIQTNWFSQSVLPSAPFSSI